MSVCIYVFDCILTHQYTITSSPKRSLLLANTKEDYVMKTEMLHGMIDVVDMEGHVSGWDLVYDNGYIEIDPEQCGYSTFLGAAVPEVDDTEETSLSGKEEV